MIISILGTIKAGLHYLPINLDTPLERFKNVISNSHAKSIITTSKLETNLEELKTYLLSNKIKIIKLDLKLIKHYPSYNPNVPINRNNLAYTIYTSGTTGAPKEFQ